MMHFLYGYLYLFSVSIWYLISQFYLLFWACSISLPLLLHQPVINLLFPLFIARKNHVQRFGSGLERVLRYHFPEKLWKHGEHVSFSEGTESHPETISRWVLIQCVPHPCTVSWLRRNVEKAMVDWPFLNFLSGGVRLMGCRMIWGWKMGLSMMNEKVWQGFMRSNEILSKIWQKINPFL